MFARTKRQPYRRTRRQRIAKPTPSRTWAIVASVAVVALVSVYVASAAISLSTSLPYNQNFDSMGIPSSNPAPSNLPSDFRQDTVSAVRTLGSYSAASNQTARVAGANMATNAASGSYNFGAGNTSLGDADRAAGFISSGTAAQSGNLYAQLQNNTGGSLAGLLVSYDVEKYRNGSNPAGFRIQLFYSSDGLAWTSAGPDFLISFAADANNNGFATAPGATTSVINKTLNVSVANSANLYLAWNYSVISGTTTTNAQALAIDNVSILGIGTGGATSPTGIGTASPAASATNAPTLLTVAVTPGTNPPSMVHTVSADLTAIGGSASQQFFDDGSNGDAIAGDNVFSYNATVANGTKGGSKSLPFTITETSPFSRTGSGSISFTVLVPTSPAGVGTANPSSVQAGNSTVLTVSVTPGANPTSTGLDVTADLNAIGGSSNQQFFDDGTHGDVNAGDSVFSFNATVAATTTLGAKSLPFTITDVQSRSGSGSTALTVLEATVQPATIVISQLYGGGGNSGSTYKNDFVELFNRSNNAVNLTGWSVQYASATGNFGGSSSRTTLSGSLAPGQYYLVQLAAGAGGTTDLPTPEAAGTTNMSASDGKVALVSNNSLLSGNCPLPNANVIDFVGYGGAICFEGAAAAPGLDNVTADIRTHQGCKDTDSNGGNFVNAEPNPRNSTSATNTCSGGDYPPEVFGTSPAANETHVPQDTNITIKFDEPVDLSGNWFQISCASTGQHSATVSGGPVSFTLDPDTDFAFNEPCTVTVLASQVTDQDFNDPPDNMAADYVFAFNSEFLRNPAEHMILGNPSNAVSDPSATSNFLMLKTQYALSYNDSRGAANWTSWHLDSTWRGSAPRQNDFRADTSLPPGYHQVQGTDFSGSGFDRGLMCPSADRTSTVADNSATFLMTNMIAQAPDNTQGPWAAFESYLRTLLPSSEIYILSGGSGTGGTGSNGSVNTIAGGFVNVPAVTWKVALILPVGDNDLSRVDNATRTIAVIIPNTQGIRSDQWQKYLATVDQAETLTGYDFYSNVPSVVQDVIETRLDTENDTAPVTSGQTKTTAEDQVMAVTLSATDFNVNNIISYTIVDAPLHGSLSGNNANLTYSPNPHYSGPDSFAFKANDGAFDSNVSIVNVTVTEVNNDPVATNDGKVMAEDTTLNFASSDLTGNDSPGPDEANQTVTVDAVISTPNTHGSVVLSNGQITYIPQADYNGPASFDYHVCDDGTTNNAADSKCTTGTVNVTVTESNDDPVALDDSKNADEDSALNFPATDLTANDGAGPGNEGSQTLAVTTVNATANTHGVVALSNGAISYAPDLNYDGPASFNYQVCDNGTTNGLADPKCATGTVNVTVAPVNDSPTANNQSVTTNANTPVSITLTGSDLETASDGLIFAVTVSPAHGSLSGTGPNLSYSPAADYSGPDSFMFTVRDAGAGAAGPLTSAEATVSIAVNDTIPPTISAPPSLTVNTGAGATSCGALVTDGTLGGATGNDNAGSVSISRSGVPSGNVFPVGTTTITYTATDAVGNTRTATQTVTVIDNTPPTVTAPAPITVSANNSCQSTIPNVVPNTSASDNCSVIVTQSPAAGTLVGLGTHTITVTAKDPAGNIATTTTSFVVVDATPPNVAAPPPTTVNAGASGQAQIPDVVPQVVASDSCSAVILRQSPAAGTLVGVGTHTITITATDAAGNANTSTTTFTVNGGGFAFSIRVSPTTVSRGEHVKLEIAFSNATAHRILVTFKIRYTSPCGNATIDHIGPISIRAGADRSATIPFHVPKRACAGLYTLILESYVEGALSGTTTAQLTVTP